jgi:aerobic carbon-monoxide dehydrogenase small subunit
MLFMARGQAFRAEMSARYLEIMLNVNGEPVTACVEARKTLVDFLRDDLALTGSHVGCEHGVSGACTVLLNGETVRGCLTFAVQCDGVQVETIEGLSDSGAVADLQRAFQERNALQCGYCTPGILISARELLAAGDVPSRETIREHLSGHYCRCTGYQAIVDAIEAVARLAPPPRAGEVASEASRRGQVFVRSEQASPLHRPAGGPPPPLRGGG